MFSLADFKIFFIVFSFQRFDYDISGPKFPYVYPAKVLLKFIKVRDFYISTNLRSFSHYSFKHFLLTTFFLFSFWDSSDMNVTTFGIILQVPRIMPIYFSMYFLFLFEMDNLKF